MSFIKHYPTDARIPCAPFVLRCAEIAPVRFGVRRRRGARPRRVFKI